MPGFNTRSHKVVSDALRSALLRSICVTLSKLPPESFPIAPSIFYGKHILPYRSSRLEKSVGTPVNIRHSGFKSLTAFLVESTKEGLIKTKNTKEGLVITGVDGSHPNVQAHARHVTAKVIEAHKEKEEEVQTQEMEKAQEKYRERQVTLLRKPGPVSATFFWRISKDPEELFTKKDIKTIINQYLASKNLFKPHDPYFVDVTQDKLLLDIVLNGKEDSRAELLKKKFVHTNEVISRIFNGAKAWYKISIGNSQPIIREGIPHPISVNTIRRHNHTITYISGFEIFRLDAESLAEGLKMACASSTNVQPISRKPELKQIMVQGEHVKAVTEYLIARGIQVQWIEVMNRTGGKKTQTGKRTPV